MARYAASFTISCMTRQAFEALARQLSQTTDVSSVRLAASFVAGVMLLECETESREALDAWMQREHLHPTSVMRLDIEAVNGTITAL